MKKEIKNMNVTVNAINVDDAFLQWVEILTSQSEESSLDSRVGSVVGEVLNAVTVIEDPTRLMTNNIRRMPMRYAVGELLWYLSGNNKKSAIRPYTKAWEELSDDGITVNSNYGYCIQHKYGFDQFEYVEELFRKDRNTRQAVIHIKEASNKRTKDMNCTIALQFFVRDDKMHLTAYMRSNDIWLGFPYDIFNFTAMQILLAMKLDLEIGTYTHIAGSLHLYEKDLKTIKERQIQAIEKEAR